jgi:hypothetical protein
MGAACGRIALELAVRALAPDENNAEGEAADATCHVLILALDYPGTGNELTCTQDGDNMQELCRMCGVTDVTVLYNNQANREMVLAKIEEIGERCEEGDYFIFNYSGHGTSVPDKDGDEDDGMDEALCLVTPDGRLDFGGFLTDDDFAEAITDACDEGVKILIMCDCCHSGTIGDFQSDMETWEGHTALSMSGCADDQTSGDVGGGIWTHSLLMAIQQLQEEGVEEYSIAQLYNKQLAKDDQVFNSQQDIQLKWSKDLGGATNMEWPLVPKAPYVAPYTKRMQQQQGQYYG